ncbi:MAG: DUF5719 family protein, partial [Propionicimonas sp.]
SSDGRFAAFLRQRSWSGRTPLGGDWLAAAAEPATEQVIPGVAAGSGGRQLVVANPGERTTTVEVGFLGADGSGELAGAEQLEVPPQTTRTLDLTAGLSGQAVALTIRSVQPVTAAVLQDTGSAAVKHDPAFSAATPRLPADSVWPLGAGKKAATVLALANPSAAEVTATVALGTGATAGTDQEVVVPPGSQVQVAVPAAAVDTVRIRTAAQDLRGALVTTEKLGTVDGLAVWPLAEQESAAEPAVVVFDPRLGS